MTQILSQILLSISLITTGSALRCYKCSQNTNSTSAGKLLCNPEPYTCKNTSTHCLSVRRRVSRNSEVTYKACAGDSTCVSAHAVCQNFLNNSSSGEEEECDPHCCKEDLCNLQVHANESNNIERKGSNPTDGGSVGSIPVPLTALMTSLWLTLLNSCGLT